MLIENFILAYIISCCRENLFERPLTVDVEVKFKENQVFPLIWKESFDILFFLSNVGGIFGLLLGSSIMTFIELIYFFTLRVVFRNWKKQQAAEEVPDIQNRNFLVRLALQTARSVSKLLQNYFSNSSLHSVVYIAKRHWVEKGFWITCFTCSVVICITSSRNLYQSMEANPIVISMNEEPRSIESIPFPAVTLVGDYGMLRIFTNLFVGMQALFYGKYYAYQHYRQGNYET